MERRGEGWARGWGMDGCSGVWWWVVKRRACSFGGDVDVTRLARFCCKAEVAIVEEGFPAPEENSPGHFMTKKNIVQIHECPKTQHTTLLPIDPTASNFQALTNGSKHEANSTYNTYPHT